MSTPLPPNLPHQVPHPAHNRRSLRFWALIALAVFGVGLAPVIIGVGVLASVVADQGADTKAAAPAPIPSAAPSTSTPAEIYEATVAECEDGLRANIDTAADEPLPSACERLGQAGAQAALERVADESGVDASTPTTAAPAATTAAPKPAAHSMTVAQREAIESAESYLAMSGFSKKGLLKQLTSEYGEGFKRADAQYAVDHITVNWKAEAVEAGRSYLEMGGFSRSELIKQLSSAYGDEFTRSEATYAADKLGL